MSTKLYQVQRYEADTCGNQWAAVDPVYVWAGSAEAVRDELDKLPRGLCGYWVSEIDAIPLSDLVGKMRQINRGSSGG